MKRFFVIFVMLVLCLSLCACGSPSVQVEPNFSVTSMFVEVESNISWRVVYHRETNDKGEGIEPVETAEDDVV